MRLITGHSRRLVFDDDAIDARPRGTLSKLLLETGQGLSLTHRQRFDVPARKVANPAEQPLAFGSPLHEVAESNTLDSTADEVPVCEGHYR